MLMRKVQALGALVLCIALVALGGGSARADAFSPVLVVFPFQPQGSVAPKVGEQISLVLAQSIADGGGVTVKAPPPTSTKETFQQDARTLGAAYYISGYVTPFGNQLSLVEYVVSVRTGTIIYSATAQAANVSDVQTQAYTLRKALLELASHDSGVDTAAAPAPSAAPSAPAKAAAAPAAASVAAAPQTRGERWVIVNVAGGRDAQQRGAMRQALADALKGAGVDAVVDDDPAPQGGALAKVICDQNTATRLVAATIHPIRGGSTFDGSVDAALLDCSSGATLRQVSGSGSSMDRAAQATAAALVAPAPQRRRRS
ncbi:hypothetical protein EPN52_09875 [bacterium]|nr:MAG: hypothetical protein EPN52_09875 [bacterium]